MKHRSPLVTLAVVALAFAIMFTVNMLSGPPGSGSTGTAVPSAAQQTTPASSPSPQPRVTATASASETAEDSEFPGKVVYAGRTDDGLAAIAVAVLGNQAAAYVCDGSNVEAWFRGTVEGGNISLRSKSGATLEAELDGDHLKGTVEIKNDTQRFEINEANKPAGLYRARGSKTVIGWIVLEDGSQVGVQSTSADSSAAPQLDPENPQVTVNGEDLDAAPVNGDEEL